MAITRRVYVSLPADRWIPANLNDLKWAIVEEIEKLGYTPEVFTNPLGKPGLASARAWSAGGADEVARRCCGAVVLGMQRWKFTEKDGAPVLLPTEYNHYEGALFRTLRLPTLVLVQKNVLRRVVFADTFAGYVGEFQPTDDEKWLRTNEFRVPFRYWKEALAERRDVFLGYSSRSKKAAATLKRFLQSKGVTVLDWLTDFIPGRTILEQIEQAATRSVGGIFLFTKDDLLADSRKEKLSVPRDNVVFEAGYFIGTKGKHNVLIIRQAGSKLPADLGGDIYVNLPKRAEIDSVETEVETFISAL
jgi:hypothetical protein